MSAIKKIPASETGYGVQCHTKTKKEYLISHCLQKKRFTLWKCAPDGFEKLETAASPFDLYPLIPWEK